MKLRSRNKWRLRGKHRSLDDNAAALAYIIWQIALTAAKNLHAEDFEYQDDTQRMAVIAEYLIFLVHVADRLCFDRLDPSQRSRFVTVLAKAAARHYQRNMEDVYGAGAYGEAFVASLNERVADYAQTRFDNVGPGYEARRLLGEKVQDIMGMSQTNRWVIQQIIDVDAPDAVSHLRQGLDNLLETSAPTPIHPADTVVGPD